MHVWGDSGVDWEGINKCAEYIGLNLRKWGRVGVRDYKEKYGTVRVYCSLGWRSLFSITHPGWVSYKVAGYPKWLMAFDIYVLSRIIPYLNYIIVPYHKWLYRKLYKNCVKKYPHLREEILACADFDELLKDL